MGYQLLVCFIANILLSVQIKINNFNIHIYEDVISFCKYEESISSKLDLHAEETATVLRRVYTVDVEFKFRM
jgi:hypothetical protein